MVKVDVPKKTSYSFKFHAKRSTLISCVKKLKALRNALDESLQMRRRSRDVPRWFPTEIHFEYFKLRREGDDPQRMTKIITEVVAEGLAAAKQKPVFNMTGTMTIGENAIVTLPVAVDVFADGTMKLSPTDYNDVTVTMDAQEEKDALDAARTQLTHGQRAELLQEAAFHAMNWPKIMSNQNAGSVLVAVNSKIADLQKIK